MVLLELKNVSSGYGSKRVLNDFCLEVAAGEITLLVGSNGSGKSTLLKTIYGLADIMPSDKVKGRIYFNGEEISKIKTFQLLDRGLTYIPQKNKCFDNLTVNENLQLSGVALKDRALYKKRFDEVLSYFPMLHELLDRKPIKMSGGERQFLALGMAFLHHPKMMLIDEPLAGLSPQSIETIKEIIKQLNSKQAITFLIAEHMISEALTLTNRLIVLKLGNFVRDVVVDESFDKDSLIQLFI